jgi:hypothetical protein
MAFHGFATIEIPLHDKLFVSVHMHMPRRVIPLPPNKDVPAPAEFTYSPFMLPRRVTFVNVRISCQCLKNLAVEQAFSLSSLILHNSTLPSCLTKSYLPGKLKEKDYLD